MSLIWLEKNKIQEPIFFGLTFFNENYYLGAKI